MSFAGSTPRATPRGSYADLRRLHDAGKLRRPETRAARRTGVARRSKSKFLFFAARELKFLHLAARKLTFCAPLLQAPLRAPHQLEATQTSRLRCAEDRSRPSVTISVPLFRSSEIVFCPLLSHCSPLWLRSTQEIEVSSPLSQAPRRAPPQMEATQTSRMRCADHQRCSTLNHKPRTIHPEPYTLNSEAPTP